MPDIKVERREAGLLARHREERAGWVSSLQLRICLLMLIIEHCSKATVR